MAVVLMYNLWLLLQGKLSADDLHTYVPLLCRCVPWDYQKQVAIHVMRHAHMALGHMQRESSLPSPGNVDAEVYLVPSVRAARR